MLAKRLLDRGMAALVPAADAPRTREGAVLASGWFAAEQVTSKGWGRLARLELPWETRAPCFPLGRRWFSLGRRWFRWFATIYFTSALPACPRAGGSRNESGLFPTKSREPTPVQGARPSAQSAWARAGRLLQCLPEPKILLRVEEPRQLLQRVGGKDLLRAHRPSRRQKC